MTREEREEYNKKVDTEIKNQISDTAKLNAEARKFMAETDKMRAERLLYPMVVASGATLAIDAVVKMFL